MKIIAINHAADHHRPEGRRGSIRETVFLDHIGDELRGVYGDIGHEPLPDSLSVLAALIDLRTERGDQA